MQAAKFNALNRTTVVLVSIKSHQNKQTISNDLLVMIEGIVLLSGLVECVYLVFLPGSEIVLFFF